MSYNLITMDMGNIKIEVFKEEITTCIDKYENNNFELKNDINKYNFTAENIKTDINKVAKKHIEIRYRQCICAICNSTIKDDKIYLFSCGHIFDSVYFIYFLELYFVYVSILCYF